MTFIIAGGVTAALAFLTFWILGKGRSIKKTPRFSWVEPEIKLTYLSMILALLPSGKLALLPFLDLEFP